MSSKMQIQNFNQKLIDENVEINIIDYVKLLNNESYHIDISFIDDLLLLIDKDECCIHHKLLYKYGVLSGYNANDVKALLCQHGFLENESYKVNYGTFRSRKNIYYMTPDTFKYCLIRPKNTNKYAKYYILLEKCKIIIVNIRY